MTTTQVHNIYEELERAFDLLERIDPQYRQFATLTEAHRGRTGFDILLEAASLDDVHAKYYSSIPRDTFERIVSADPTSGTDKMGRYGKWLLGLYKGGRLKEEDLYKAKQYLSLCDKSVFISTPTNRTARTAIPPRTAAGRRRRSGSRGPARCPGRRGARPARR